MKKGKGPIAKQAQNNLEGRPSQQHRVKSKHFETQMKVAFEAFFSRPKTMLEVSVQTGILRANICRYVAEWLEMNKIKLVSSGFCSISLHRAGRYSTNPECWKNAKGGEHAV